MMIKQLFNSLKPIIIYPDKIWIEKPTHNLNFVGRDVELQWIQQNLYFNNVIGVLGGAGIGKTSIVNEYIRRFVGNTREVFIYHALKFSTPIESYQDFVISCGAGRFPRRLPKYVSETISEFPNNDRLNHFLIDNIFSNSLIVIDDANQNTLNGITNFIKELQREENKSTKMIVIGRNFSWIVNKAPILRVQGLTQMELAEYYYLSGNPKWVSEVNFDQLWKKTSGIPLFNQFILDCVMERSWEGRKINLCNLVKISENLEDYFFETYCALSKKERKVIEVLNKFGKIRKSVFFLYLMMLFGVKSKAAIDSLIQRSAIYENDIDFYLPEITKDYLEIHYKY